MQAHVEHFQEFARLFSDRPQLFGRGKLCIQDFRSREQRNIAVHGDLHLFEALGDRAFRDDENGRRFTLRLALFD